MLLKRRLRVPLTRSRTTRGIRVTLVEPGPFRTDLLGGSLVLTGKTIEDYNGTAGQTRTSARERNGAQPGDPVRASKRGQVDKFEMALRDRPVCLFPLREVSGLAR